jgi:hypothetical protein
LPVESDAGDGEGKDSKGDAEVWPREEGKKIGGKNGDDPKKSEQQDGDGGGGGEAEIKHDGRFPGGEKNSFGFFLTGKTVVVRELEIWGVENELTQVIILI